VLPRNAFETATPLCANRTLGYLFPSLTIKPGFCHPCSTCLKPSEINPAYLLEANAVLIKDVFYGI